MSAVSTMSAIAGQIPPWAGGSAAAFVLLVVSLWLTLPSGAKHRPGRRALSVVLGLLGLVILWGSVPSVGVFAYQAAFVVLAIVAIGAAVATISAHSPVYSAIAFAVSLLGIAALFLLHGAQFLGVATVAVYVGAIVVTFLFVLMLAQPEGHAYFDRVSWGITPRWIGSMTAVLFVILISLAVTRPDQAVINDRRAMIDELNQHLETVVPAAEVRAVRYESDGTDAIARVTVAVPPDDREVFRAAAASLAKHGLQQLQSRHPDWQIGRIVLDDQDVLTADNTASLGSRLFTGQLVAIQAAGALLMAALVGAVAIAGRTGSMEAKA